MKLISCIAAAFIVLLPTPPTAPAASLYLHIPGIMGEQSTPGYPGAMSIQSLVVMPAQFVITKNIDAASPAIFSAVANGTPFSSASVLLYNSTTLGPPDATLTFQNVVASGYQLQGGGTFEQDSFVATTPGSIFLELPGIVGESSTPGHTGVIQIDSFSLTPSQFSITKPVDSTSPDIMSAVISGTPFAAASVLFYNAPIPSGPPDGIFSFGDVVASGYQILNGGDLPHERDSFSFASVPEPATATLLLCVVLFCLTWPTKMHMTPPWSGRPRRECVIRYVVDQAMFNIRTATPLAALSEIFTASIITIYTIVIV